MSENNPHGLVPVSRKRSELGVASVAGVTESSFQGIYEKIGVIRNDPRLPFRDKRALITDQVKAIVHLEREHLKITEEAVTSALYAQLEEFKLRLRERLIAMSRTLGRQVNMDELTHLADMGEDLTQFQEQLKNRKIETRMRKDIEKVARQAFNITLSKISERIADKLASSASAEGR
jgi:hypothetical protein